MTNRKFYLTVLTVILTALLTSLEKIHEGVYSAVVIAVVGGYLAANVTQKGVLKDATSK